MDFPKRRVTVAGIIVNSLEEILLVKPTYRKDGKWLFVGGMVEPDEKPSKACEREVSEELGLKLPVNRILCIDYRSPHDAIIESYHFVFDLGQISEIDIYNIKIPKNELQDYGFFYAKIAYKILPYRNSERLKFALLAKSANQVIYLENGIPTANNINIEVKNG